MASLADRAAHGGSNAWRRLRRFGFRLCFSPTQEAIFLLPDENEVVVCLTTSASLFLNFLIGLPCNLIFFSCVSYIGTYARPATPRASLLHAADSHKGSRPVPMQSPLCSFLPSSSRVKSLTFASWTNFPNTGKISDEPLNPRGGQKTETETDNVYSPFSSFLFAFFPLPLLHTPRWTPGDKRLLLGCRSWQFYALTPSLIHSHASRLCSFREESAKAKDGRQTHNFSHQSSQNRFFVLRL